MGKVLKGIVIGALVVVGLVYLLPFIGITSFTPFVGLFGITTPLLAAAVGGGILGGLSVLLAPSMDLRTVRARLRISIDANANMKWVFGETALATDVVYAAQHGDDDKYYTYIIAGAAHLIDSFGDLYINDELITFGGALGDESQFEWAGALRRRFRIGTETQIAFGNIGADDNFAPGLWPADATGLGMAYYRLRWDITHPKISSGLPSRVTQICKGGPVYDPRLDSTRGGAGTHRADDQTTWQYNDGVDDIGANWALIVLRYLIGWQINGKLVIGMGIDPDDIDMDQVMAAANVCEELVDGVPRYRIGGILPVTNDHPNIIRQLEGAINGKVARVGGKYFIWAPNDDLTPFSDIVEGDLIRDAGVVFTPSGPMESLFNTARGSYVSNAVTDLFNLVPYPDVEEATAITEDGGVRVKNHDLSMVQEVSIAERVVRGLVRRSRFGASWRFAMGPKGLTFQPFTVTTLNCQETNFVNEIVRIIDVGYSVSGAVVLEVIEEDSSIYDTTAPLGTPVTQLDPGGFDPNAKIAVTGLASADFTVTGTDGTSSVGFDVTWNDPGAWVQETQVQFKIATDAEWSAVPSMRVDLQQAIIIPTEPNTLYDIRARHVTRFGVVGDWVSIQDTAPIPAVGLPTSLTATSVFEGIELNWTNPQQATFELIEIHASDDNVRANAVIIAEVAGPPFTEVLIENPRVRFYWIRARNSVGELSNFEPNTSTTTATAGPRVPGTNIIVDPDFDKSTSLTDPGFWGTNVKQGVGPLQTGAINFITGGGANSSNAIDMIWSGGSGAATELIGLQRHRVNFAAFEFRLRYQTIGAGGGDHIITIGVDRFTAETGGTSNGFGSLSITLPRSVGAWTAVALVLEVPDDDTLQYFRFVVSLFSGTTLDTFRLDSFFVHPISQIFGTQVISGDLQPGLVPTALAADSTNVLQGDGTWVPNVGGGVAFDDLTDVDLTGAADNDLLFRSGGNWIDTAGKLTWDGSDMIISSPNLGGLEIIRESLTLISAIKYSNTDGVKGFAGFDDAGSFVILDPTTLESFFFNNVGQMQASGGAPSYRFNENVAPLPPVDEQRWRITANAGELLFQAWNDAETLSDTFMTVSRTAEVVDNITLGAPLIIDSTLFLLERATALADTLTYGQFWVRDDQFPMFTDELGIDFDLAEPYYRRTPEEVTAGKIPTVFRRAPHEDARRYGAALDGSDDSTAFADCFAVSKQTVLMYGTSAVKDLTIAAEALNGQNVGKFTAFLGATDVLVVDATPGDSWRYKQISNLEIDAWANQGGGTIRTVNGIALDRAGAHLAAGLRLETAYIKNADKGLYKPNGSIGLHAVDVTIKACNYCIFAEETTGPIQHVGADRYEGGEWSGSKKAAVYLKNPTQTTGGILFHGNIVEGNEGHAFYFDGANLIPTMIELNAVWVENNGTEASGTIDLGFGRGVETYRDIMCHDVDHIRIIGMHCEDTGWEFNNSMALLDGCFFNSESLLVRSADSVVRCINANLEGIDGSSNVIIESLVQQRRFSGNNGAGMKAQIVPRDHIVYSLPGTGVGVYSETMAHVRTHLADGTFPGTRVESPTKGPGLYPWHMNFTLDSDIDAYGELIPVVLNKWYVYTVDTMVASGEVSKLDFQNGIFFLITNLDSPLRDNVPNGEWATLGGVVKYTDDSGSGNVRFRAARTTATATEMNLGQIQVVQFDTEGEAIDYFNSRAFWQETRVDDWQLVTGNVTLNPFDKITITNTSGSTKTATLPAAMIEDDEIIVHNASTSTDPVVIDPASHSIKGAGGTVTSSDTMLLAPGETVHLVAVSTSVMEVI